MYCSVVSNPTSVNGLWKVANSVPSSCPSTRANGVSDAARLKSCKLVIGVSYCCHSGSGGGSMSTNRCTLTGSKSAGGSPGIPSHGSNGGGRKGSTETSSPMGGAGDASGLNGSGGAEGGAVDTSGAKGVGGSPGGNDGSSGGAGSMPQGLPGSPSPQGLPGKGSTTSVGGIASKGRPP